MHQPSSSYVLELYALAREYCQYTEKIVGVEASSAWEYYRKVLPLLYVRGSMLTDTEPETEMPERFVTEQQWGTVFNDLRQVFGPADDFHYIDHTDPADVEPWKGSLADHLADIYQDLKDFQILFEKGTHSAQENAVFQCHQLFINRWGERLTRSLYVLHALVFRNPDTYEDL